MTAGGATGIGARILGWTLGAGVVGAIVFASRVPVGVEAGARAEVVLSWRYQEAATQECRPYTEQELARLPIHMRGEGVCERRLPPHRLEVELDGELVIDEVVHPGGRSEDRPISILKQLPLEPGVHRLSVRFDVEPSDGSTPPPGTGPDPLNATVTLSAGEVALVTLSDTGDSFELRRGAGRDE